MAFFLSVSEERLRSIQKTSQKETKLRVDEIESMSRELDSLREKLREKEKAERNIQDYYETNMSILKEI